MGSQGPLLPELIYGGQGAASSRWGIPGPFGGVGAPPATNVWAPPALQGAWQAGWGAPLLGTEGARPAPAVWGRSGEAPHPTPRLWSALPPPPPPPPRFLCLGLLAVARPWGSLPCGARRLSEFRCSPSPCSSPLRSARAPCARSVLCLSGTPSLYKSLFLSAFLSRHLCAFPRLSFPVALSVCLSVPESQGVCLPPSSLPLPLPL